VFARRARNRQNALRQRFPHLYDCLIGRLFHLDTLLRNSVLLKQSSHARKQEARQDQANNWQDRGSQGTTAPHSLKAE
jgi:hypothetical protein